MEHKIILIHFSLSRYTKIAAFEKYFFRMDFDVLFIEINKSRVIFTDIEFFI